jgi:glutamine synthetase type III
MTQRRLDLTLENLGTGFDATSQLADKPKGNIFQRFAALISSYAEAKYQVWEKGGRPVDF